MNRRVFLQSSVALAGLGVNSLAASPRRIRAGFLGASHSHAAAKLKLCVAHPDFELVGICEPSPQIQSELTGLKIPFVSREKLIDSSEVVFVESEVRDHFQHARAALKAGRHVHVEKPPAVKLEELRELIALARDKKLILQTGYMWRFNPGFEFLMKAVKQRWLGDVFMIRAHMANQVDPADRTDWARFGGGSFFEQASHMVDALVRLMGAPKSIHSTLRTHGSTTDSLKDNNIVTFEFEKALAVITNSSLQPNASPNRSFEVLGSQGSVLLKPIEPPVVEINLIKPAGDFPAGKFIVPMPKYLRYVDDLTALVACVRGEEVLSVTNYEEMIMVQETLLRACQMAEPPDSESDRRTHSR